MSTGKIALALTVALLPSAALADYNKMEKKEQRTEMNHESRSENIPGLGQSDTQQIRKGVRKEELTQEETTRLNEQRGQLTNDYSQYQSDGTISKEERKELRKDVKEYRGEVKTESRDSDTVQ